MITNNYYNKKDESYADSVYPKIWLGVTTAFFAVLAAGFYMKWKAAAKQSASGALPTSSTTETVNPIGSDRH